MMARWFAIVPTQLETYGVRRHKTIGNGSSGRRGVSSVTLQGQAVAIEVSHPD